MARKVFPIELLRDKIVGDGSWHSTKAALVWQQKISRRFARVVRCAKITGLRPMATPQLNESQIAQVCGLVAQYIEHQRGRFAPRAVPLSTQQHAAMSDFFTQALLASTRLLVLRRERVANPDFYPMLRNLGFDNLPDQSAMAAITFSDVVVSHGPFSNTLLFHELVHVEQYKQLGIPRFSELYVRGFLSGGSYEAIPLEMNAYQLEGQYESDPGRHFSVSNRVQTLIREGRF
jgi:hypothetical protein